MPAWLMNQPGLPVPATRVFLREIRRSLAGSHSLRTWLPSTNTFGTGAHDLPWSMAKLA